LLVFPEERYYGASLPFGEGGASFTPENLVFLTTEQVLEDYVELLSYLKASLSGAADCPAVAFGGSYGGTLTTFLRAAYPAAVVGGLASSAPVGYYDQDGWAAHGVDAFTWSDIASRDYDEADPNCLTAIHSAAAAVDAADADAALLGAFGVCEASGLGPTSQSDLFLYALEGLPQMDYPYEVGGLPAWPVNASCATLVAALEAAEQQQQHHRGGEGFGRVGASGDSLLVAAAANVTRMALGIDAADDGCMATLDEGPGGIPGDGPAPQCVDDAWCYQSCTETLHAFSSRGLRNYSFDLASSATAPCASSFSGTVQPDPEALTQRFGGYALGDGLAGVTNLIWSNGLLDPWSGGGFLVPPPDADESGNHWIMMPNGAHHLDLRAPHDDDPADVTAARKREEAIIWGWITDYAGKGTAATAMAKKKKKKKSKPVESAESPS
jgi:lysosomal Pro-X carboxypeptidase